MNQNHLYGKFLRKIKYRVS